MADILDYNYDEVWNNILPDEEYKKRVDSLTMLLSDNPEAHVQLMDILSDFDNLRDELGARADLARGLQETVRKLQESNLAMVSQVTERNARRGNLREERREVANSESRTANGRFAGYNNYYDGYRGQTPSYDSSRNGRIYEQNNVTDVERIGNDGVTSIVSGALERNRRGE